MLGGKERPGAEARPLSFGGDRADNTAAPQIPQRLERAGRTIALGLVNLRLASLPGHDDPDTWAAGMAAILRARLGPVERVGLATASLLSLDTDEAEALAEQTLAELRQGAPVPPFLSPREDARDWAAWASPAECKAYLTACWGRLPDRDRSAFMRAAKVAA